MTEAQQEALNQLAGQVVLDMANASNEVGRDESKPTPGEVLRAGMLQAFSLGAGAVVQELVDCGAAVPGLAEDEDELT